MNADDIRTLFEYNSWANHRALESCTALNNEQFTRDLGSSFKSVRDTLVHTLRRRMALARALSRPLAFGPAVRRGLRRSRRRPRPLGRRRARHERFHRLPHRSRSRPRLRIQNHARRPASAARLADAAASRQSRHLSPRPDRHHAPPTRRQSPRHRHDLFLPRALRKGLHMNNWDRRFVRARLQSCRRSRKLRTALQVTDKSLFAVIPNPPRRMRDLHFLNI